MIPITIKSSEHGILNAFIEEDLDGRWSAVCPSLVGCASWGNPKEEATFNIKEAIELYLGEK